MANYRLQEAEHQHNEARALLDSMMELQRERKSGRGQAEGWQAVREDALEILTRANMQPAVIVLFSELLAGVQKKSDALTARHIARLAAAREEAESGADRTKIVAAYAASMGRPARGCYEEVDKFRESPFWKWMVEAYQPFGGCRSNTI